MGTIVFQKIKNKKILNLCLVIGIALLVAVMSCSPMFREGSLDMLLRSKLSDKLVEENEYPIVASRSGSADWNGIAYDDVNNKCEEYFVTWEKYLKLPSVAQQKHIWVSIMNATHKYGNNTEWLNVGTVPGYKDHTELLVGSYDLEEGVSDVYPCVITESVMDNCRLVVGDVITSKTITNSKTNKNLSFMVTGIVKEKTEESYFWYRGIRDFDKQLYVDEEVMADIISDYATADEKINYDIYDLLDYSVLENENIDSVSYYFKEFSKKDANFSYNLADLTKSYETDRSFVKIICLVLELPIILLLLAFIYMIVNQILGMETGEISMLTSRGFKRKPIMVMYFEQALILSLAGLLVGLPLGYLLCKAAAGTDGFLKFTLKDVSTYHARMEMIPYGLVGVLLAILFITIPVAFYAKDSIVERRTIKINKTERKALYGIIIEVLMLCVSLYLLINHKKQRDLISLDVLNGRKMDPVIFLNVSFFLFICGLLGLRLIHYFVRFIYYMGRKKWKPHSYVALLQILRGDRKSQFISVFLILTISMGIVDANIAGTINTNNSERIEYNIGSDLVIKEQWVTKTYMDVSTRKAIKYYEEPDFQRYKLLLADETTSMTRVLRDDDVRLAFNASSAEGCTMLAINTKEFGETAYLKDGLNSQHWYELLNKLGSTTNGILVSKNFADKYKVKEGDVINYYKMDPAKKQKKDNEIKISGIICGIFDAMPSAQSYDYVREDYETDDENGEIIEEPQYSIIVNYAYEVNVAGDAPYEIWMKLKDGVTKEQVVDKIKGENIVLLSANGIDDSISKMQSTAMIQITNGLFSLSFVISIVLCAIGFLIYWITSLKQRELMFGIYRAMGMSFKEVNGMLTLEQLLSSLTSGLLGLATGMIASLIYSGVVAIVYLPKKHNIELHTVIDVLNLGRFLVVIIIMVIVCLFVLKRQIKKMNMITAIKMGDD